MPVRRPRTRGAHGHPAAAPHPRTPSPSLEGPAPLPPGASAASGNALRSYRPWACLVWLFAAALLASCGGSAPEGRVHILTLDGIINPVTAGYVERGIGSAEDSAAEVLVIQLDTPGGLDSAMRDIVQNISASSVPVVVYVAPAGARAASAGTFITMAAHVAAMAPSTAIGAAHPVGAGGEDLEGDIRSKAENDAVAYIRSIAEEHGRNADWAERAVRESESVPASEAVELNVVDLEAESLEELLATLDGREVTLTGGVAVTLETAGTPRHQNGMNFSERLLMLISDPNIAFLLLSLGTLAILFELYNPSGIGLVVGGTALIVAFFSLGTLPVNWAGVALVLLAIGLFAAEFFVVSGGLLAVAGAVTLALGGLFLTTSGQPAFEVSRWLALGLPAAIGAAVGTAALFLLRGRKRAAAIGREAMIGSIGVARSLLAPGEPGYVSVRGERWRAQLDAPAGTTVAPGGQVVVDRTDGLLLIVRARGESTPDTGTDRGEGE